MSAISTRTLSPGSDQPQMVFFLPRCSTMLSPKIGLTNDRGLRVDSRGLWAKAGHASETRNPTATRRMRDFLGIMISRTSFSNSLHIFAGHWVCDNRHFRCCESEDEMHSRFCTSSETGLPVIALRLTAPSAWDKMSPANSRYRFAATTSFWSRWK